MANQKQDGSNCINIEYSTGRCRTGCEQCFVNYGQQGLATCRGIVNPGMEELLKWLDDEAKAFGRYTLPPRFRKTKLEPGREWLLRKITPGAKGFTNIPTRGAWEPWVVEKRSAEPKKFQTVKGLERLGVFPYFLRVSSMSDSSWAPFEWLDDVQGAWGGHCFFNSAIRSLRRAVKLYGVGLMDRYHKLVVTANPGSQKQRPMREQTSRALDEGKRDREANKWYRDHRHELTAAGAMGKAEDRARDFLHPESLSDLGLASYEDVIKFYRLRSLPTISPRFEVDAPVVITQMRFKGLDHCIEFCRRYRINCEVRTPRTKKGNIPPSVGKALEPFKRRYRMNVPVIADDRLPAKQVYMWTPKGHPLNVSPHAGEASVYMWQDSFFRNIHPEAFDHEDWVCDRVHGSCEHCGLCASLDGTESGWANPLNVHSDGNLMAPMPGPEGAVYLGDISPEATDFWNELYREEVALAGYEQLAGLEELGAFYRNPVEPLEPDQVADIIGAVSAYVDKELTLDTDWCEGWNTHELSAGTTAWCVWSLMVYAKRQGMSKQRAFDFVSEVVGETAGPYDVLDGLGDVWAMWDDDSEWTDQFGSTDL